MKNLLFILLLLSNNLCAQIDTAWTRCLGGTGDEAIGATILADIGSPAASIDTTNDGFLYVATTSNSSNGYIHVARGLDDVWVIKLNMNGDTIWTRNFGGSSYDRAYKLCSLSDGGCIVVGRANSNDYDFTTNHSTYNDAFLIRLNSDGSLNWKKLLGGTQDDCLYDVIQTSDGNFVACGESASSDGDLTGTGSGSNWLIKVNATNGSVMWSKTYQGPDNTGANPDYLENFSELTELSNGTGFICTGFTTPVYNDFNQDDILYAKVSLNGTLKWIYQIGSATGGDYPGAVTEDVSGSFYIAGRLAGTGGGVTNYYGGSGDVWLIRFDSSGFKTWDRNYGGTDYDFAFDMKKDTDDNLWIAGFTRSTNNDASSAAFGSMDNWVLKVNPTGDTLLTKRYGGSANDVVMSIALLNTHNSFITAGKTLSVNEYVHNNNGSQDLFVAKFEETALGVKNSEIQKNSISVFPNPATTDLYIKMTTPVSGKTQIVMFNNSGQEIFKKVFSDVSSSIHLELANMKSGIYFITIQTEEKVILKKISIL